MTYLLGELLCSQRPQSGTPWVRKFGNLLMREILVVTSVQTLGKGEGSPKAP